MTGLSSRYLSLVAAVLPLDGNIKVEHDSKPICSVKLIHPANHICARCNVVDVGKGYLRL